MIWISRPQSLNGWKRKMIQELTIRIADILHMSSGIRFRAPQDPDFDRSLGYPDHIYVYTGAVNSFEWTAKKVQQWPPNTIGRYRNCDPVLVNYLVRLGVEGQGKEYLTFPQKELFDKIGIRNMVMETDPYGNFLLEGYELARGLTNRRGIYIVMMVFKWASTFCPNRFVDFVEHPSKTLG